MDLKKRNQRLREILRRVNKQRKQQSHKIDILCNDMIAAYRDFIAKLQTISFTANFYELILGINDLNTLLYTACGPIKEKVPRTNVAFFLRDKGSFGLHLFESDQPISLEGRKLEKCFTSELVHNICEANKLCTLEDMLAMGIQGNPAELKKISAVTIPLRKRAESLGFILVYRSSDVNLTDGELHFLKAISTGLSRAIDATKKINTLSS